MAKLGLILVLLVFSANPSIAQVFPESCGRFVLMGMVHTKPNRLVLWEGTAAEKVLLLSGQCKECVILADLPVSAEVLIKNSGGPAEKLKRLKAITVFSGLDGQAAAHVLKPQVCAK